MLLKFYIRCLATCLSLVFIFEYLFAYPLTAQASVLPVRYTTIKQTEVREPEAWNEREFSPLISTTDGQNFDSALVNYESGTPGYDAGGIAFLDEKDRRNTEMPPLGEGHSYAMAVPGAVKEAPYSDGVIVSEEINDLISDEETSVIPDPRVAETTQDQPIPLPDNSVQKIYWSFNGSLTTDSSELAYPPIGEVQQYVENDAPNPTGYGELSSTNPVLEDKALKLNGAELSGRINALDAREGGFSLSFWTVGSGTLPDINVTQIVDDFLAGDSKNFTTRKFDALNISQSSDILTIKVARPNVNANDGTNDGKATQRTYSVNLNGALDGEGDHHIALVWNGEADGPNEGEIVDLAVIIDGTSFDPGEEGSQSIDGETLSDSDYYTNSQGDQIPASTLTLSGSSATIDEVRLANTILSPAAVKAFGASRYSSGEPLIAWDGLVDKNTEGNDEPYHNFSPIPNLGDEYDVSDAVSGVANSRNDFMGHNSIISKIYQFFHPLTQQRSVSLPPLEDGVYKLDGATFLANDPRDFHIDDALAMEAWFKPENTDTQEQIFEINIPAKRTISFHVTDDMRLTHDLYNCDDDGTSDMCKDVTFTINQGLQVVHNRDTNQFEVTVQTAKIERHAVRDEQDLRAALYAVLRNTIQNQTFEIVLTQSISITHPLPSMVGDDFDGDGSKLAQGTELILRGDEDEDIKYIDGQDHQILTIDDHDSTFTFKDMGFKNGLAQGGIGHGDEGGGGGGLGAGGALFIADGIVDIDNVEFAGNKAVGGVPTKVSGSGGDFHEGNVCGDAGGQGGRLNENGDDLYYSTVTDVGSGGKGGCNKNAGDNDERHFGEAGYPGTVGGFGSGGGGGGGGEGGESDKDKEDYSGPGGPGGPGGFGAGGGGGGGAGGVESNTFYPSESAGGTGGAGGAFASSGRYGGSIEDSENEEGASGGAGASGAGLGGAIFVANGTNLSGLDNQPQVSISNSEFTGNDADVESYLVGNDAADAIFIEDGSNFLGAQQGGEVQEDTEAGALSIGWSNSAANGRTITTQTDNYDREITLPTESITFTYGSDEFNNSWHHVATSFADGDVPRLYLDGIALTRTDDNPAIDLNPDDDDLNTPDLTPNRDGGFIPSDQGVVRWGDVESIAGSFTGQVDGFRLYDRDLSPDEVFRSANANVTRVIVQLDNSTSGDVYDTAQYLFQSAGSASFKTVWLTLPKGTNAPNLQQGPSDISWDDIKASLGDDFSLELIGQGNGNNIANFGDDNIDTVPNQTDITLSGYSPTELQGSLLQMLPKGISTPKIFISADNLIDPDAFLDNEHSGEKHLSAKEEPATLKFSEALMSVGLTENINYVPLARVTSSGQIEFKSNDIWLQYDQVNEENPLSIDLEWKQPGAFSYLKIAYNVYDLIDKYKNFRVRSTEAADTLLNQRTVTDSMTQFGFDDNGKILSKFTAETKHKQGTAEKIYDAFRVSEPKKVKLTSKTSKLAGFLTNTPVGATELELAGMGANPFQSTSIDSLRKQDDLSKAAQDIAKNNPDYAKESQRKDKNGFSKTSAVTTGLSTVATLVQSGRTFKDDDASTYEIAGASVKLVTGVALPIAEVGFEAAAAAGVAAAGPAAPVAAAAVLIIDLTLFVTNLIVSAVQEKKLRQEAISFASEGFSDLINDLKSSFSDADDLYISGRFSSVSPEDDERTEEDVFVAVSSWLYQALLSAYNNNEATLQSFINGLSDDQKALSVDHFILEIQNELISLPDNVQKEFLDILELWTAPDSEELNSIATDIDLLSNSDMFFGSSKNDLRNALQQFVGERLDDGGENPDTDDVFTAGEALALDGSKIRDYERNIAVYGLDDASIREDVDTGKGNDTILLGLGEFNIQANDGNDTIFLSGGFKDVGDANNEEKYYLDAGDMPGVSPVTQSLEDSDTVILEQDAFVNLTNVDGKQAVYFQGGSSNAPLFIHGVENAYGSSGDDQLISRADKNSSISGNDGDDILVTGYGVVTDAPDTQNITTHLDGGNGNDSLYGKHAGGLGYAALAGGAGNDILISDGGSISLSGGPGSDRLISSIDSNSETETVFVLGLDSGQDRIEKGLNAFDVTTNNRTELTFDFSDYQGEVLPKAENVQDILQFGEGISGKNLRVSQTDGDGTLEGEVTFSLVADDGSVLDSLNGDDSTKPNLQTGDAMTIAGNWNESGNYNHRIRTLRFGDGSSLDISQIETWDTSGTIADDTVTFDSSNTFYQGFAGNDTITNGDYGHDVILPGSGDDRVTVGERDQVLINRNLHDQDVITIEGYDPVTVALDGSIRLRDVVFAGENAADNNDNLTLTIGEGGNLVGATQTIQINGAGGNLLLQFGTGFTLDLSKMDLSEQTKAGTNDNDNLNVAQYQGLLTGGFGNDTLNGSSNGNDANLNSILIGGGGSDTLNGSTAAGDLFILGDQDGFDTITGEGGNNTVLMVNTNTEVDQNFLLQRDKIWFIDKNTVDTLKGRDDLNLDPETIPTRPDGRDLEDDDLLIYIGDENNGALIEDWGNWDDDDRLVFTNQYSGAFEINKEGVAVITPYMAQYLDLANLEDDIEANDQDAYSPWHADLGDKGSDAPTLQLNQELYDLMLEIWHPTNPVFRPGVGSFNSPPENQGQLLRFEIPGGAPRGTVVGTIVANDPEGDDLTFEILNEHFQIDNQGVVRILNPIPFNPNFGQAYTTVRVSDGQSSAQTQMRYIVVENEEPEVEEDQAFTASTSAIKGTVIGTIQAFDPLGDELTFTVTGQDFPVFAIEPHSGVLKVDNFSEDYGVRPNATKTFDVIVSDGVFDKNVDVTVRLE